jgi:hypothetical protein
VLLPKVAATPPTVTDIAPARLVPVIVSSVPPRTESPVNVIFETVGAAACAEFMKKKLATITRTAIVDPEDPKNF